MLALALQEQGGGGAWIKQMRVLRAFRLFRLFGKMGQLKRIVTAVALSIIPTLQALVGSFFQNWGGGQKRESGDAAQRRPQSRSVPHLHI
jgi:hypothetical protein